MACTRHKVGGYLLLELLIGIVVVSVGIAGCYSMVMVSRTVASQADYQSVAYQIARQQIERLSSLSAGNRQTTTGSAFTPSSSITAAYPAAAFSGSYSVSDYTPANSETMQQIVVRVNWKRAGTSNTYSSIELDQLVPKK